MKNINKLHARILMLLILITVSGCEKYLDVKSKQIFTVPNTLDDLQALLNNTGNMNEGASSYLGEVFADNYFMTGTAFNGMTLTNRQMVVWDKNLVETAVRDNWTSAYTTSIYTANNVLDIIDKIKETPENKVQRDDIIGQALFFRSFTFQNLAQIYCKPYSTTAGTDLGLVLKLNSNISEKTSRATVEETYSQIISDLKRATSLLVETAPFPTRPTKAAALALLARTFLSMRDYVNAGNFANQALQKRNRIIDYNTLMPAKAIPFSAFNEEVIFHSRAVTATPLATSRAKIDPMLFQSYNSNDLRKSLYFLANTSTADLGTYQFRGSYSGQYGVSMAWDGLSTAEMLLIRAECASRAGQKDAALNDLNALMIKRWNSSNGSWVPLTAATSDEAKNLILTERRKELVYRCLRWSDIRRLNLEGANITLTRIIDGVIYTLPPNDPRSVAPIPPAIITYGGVIQNPR